MYTGQYIDPISLIIFLFIGLSALSVGPWIALNKGRSVGKAFLLCLLTGWFGVIAVCFLESRKPCPFCSAKIPKPALICSFCGHDIRELHKK